MNQVLRSSAPLLAGILLLMIGNGLQGSLLGVRGVLEGFSTLEISVVMSGYFAGFLGGSRMAPILIRRVGHVRVFAALASFISAALILFPVVTDPWIWTALRVLLGFCFSGVYVTSESWLNNAASNEVRGKALSAYMLVQMSGIILAQWILSQGDPSGFVLFIVPSVLVSVSIAPILLSVTPTPAFETSKPMTLRELFRVSPLGCVGMFLMGGVFAAQMAMASVYASQAGFSLPQLSSFIAAIYVGAVAFQIPIGWISDHMDRRQVILGAAGVGALACVGGMLLPGSYYLALGVAFIAGGMANPLYSLLIAHTNDYLNPEDMASSSGGLLFINGVGAVGGPIVAGWLLGAVGPRGYWLMQAVLMGAVALYALWRMTRRAAVPVEDTSSYVPIMPSASPVAAEVAQEVAIERADEASDASER
ncbi:MFS transporter [Celeribacter indicus]|uniref:Major facilitator superfamily protein n=1 Tax=Celeribacter indicus TaxID=1208324 RepID=A0A0B5E1I8_9RHOB|nr:MFS transporter [Celeribacter indicus]AJE46327.1 major facilitator superfamily protein [Celeribacter indicus]SDW53479.1 Predicted arabinose efflux permease, MFS family [Celeribacter indicus]